MASNRVEELMRRAQNNEDISGASGVGVWEPFDEPVAPANQDDPVMVGRSVRLTLELVERIRKQADSKGTDASKLMRSWIEEGLLRAEIGQTLDPVTELDQALGLITHARQALREREAA